MGGTGARVPGISRVRGRGLGAFPTMELLGLEYLCRVRTPMLTFVNKKTRAQTREFMSSASEPRVAASQA